MKSLFGFFCLVLTSFLVLGQNPLIMDQYTADPSARVFDGRLYVFPSHDILANEERGRPGWFCMEDYHVFSSDNLTEWTDHGVIVSQESVPWASKDAYSMWAPDCIERDGKYYFYFPTRASDTTYNGRGFSIGVAIAEDPEGPYKPEPFPIRNVKGIDPNVLIDDDGQAYLYWSQKHIYGAKLQDDMLQLAEEPRILQKLPDEGLKEGPFVFKKDGLYYMTYPHVENKTERLEYAVGNDPLGPFEFTGVIMDEWANGCWTNHHSIVNYQNQWFLFYHHNDLSPDFDKNRSICADSLFFDPNGNIKKVIPTLRGIGVSPSTQKIQLDRYSDKSPDTAIDFLDQNNPFLGWKTVFPGQTDWVRCNSVVFNNEEKQLKARVKSKTMSSIEVKDARSGRIITRFEVGPSPKWVTVSKSIAIGRFDEVDLRVELMEGENVEIDWISFE